MHNIILDTDSYKASHFLQYPPKTTHIYSYVESRGGEYPATVFFGLQYLLKQYLSGAVVTKEMVQEASEFFAAHGLPFHAAGWERIVNVHEGRLPVTIKAVPEGLVVPTHNVLMTIENTDPECYWLVGWLETMLLRIWYPTTVATRSWKIRQLIYQYLAATSDSPDAEIDFKLHDFGSRGVSSMESAMIGGAAHLVNFKGSDTVPGVICANRYYNHPMAAFSIPAAEHSTITSWGKEHEVDAYQNMVQQFGKPGNILAVVSDSYDLRNAVSHIWGEQLKDQVIASGATVVIRPDSGDPVLTALGTVQLLEDKFGVTLNRKGYKVLNNVRVIYGDGINEKSIGHILYGLQSWGYSASNMNFGMGGALLQQVNRDTQKFAMKCSWALIDGKEVKVMKKPLGDAAKASKAGRFELIRLNGLYRTAVTTKLMQEAIDTDDVMKEVFRNGDILVEHDFESIRARALESHLQSNEIEEEHEELPIHYQTQSE